MPSPAVSVIMSVYNGARFLGPAIESVLAQTHRDFEFLIVDDGSSDGTAAILQDYACGDSRIRLILRENRGLVASLNELVHEARAPLLARMDADDLCLPSRLEKQVAFMHARPEYGVVGTWTLDIDEHGTRYPLKGHDHPETHAGFLEAIEKDRPLLCHPAVMMRRAVVLSVGGYHAAFRHCEDYDLWLRLASVTKIGNLPERLLRYRHYPEQVSSRHVTEQQIGAATAKIAYRERLAGRPDPTAKLGALPPLDEMDALFGREGIAREIRARVAPNLLYSPIALRDDGFEVVLRYVRESGATPALWRTAVRLAKFGDYQRALKLARTLASAPRRATLDRQAEEAPSAKDAPSRAPAGSRPAISVCMSVYNNAPYLREAIASIRAQTFADFEFLIVNDGSRDGSLEILRDEASRDARIRVIDQENRGLVSSLNRLIGEARAPWIARMDGDDICLPERFEIQTAFIARNPGHLAIGGNNVLIDATGAPLPQGGAKPVTQAAIIANLEYGPLLSHPSAMIETEALRAIGGYRAAYRHCEDHDLWLRLSERGMLGNCPEVLVKYRVYPEQVSSRHVIEQTRNAAIAWLAHQARAQGKADPTEGLDELPPLNQLNRLFERPDAESYVRRRVLERICYQPDLLAGEGYPVLLDQIRCDGAQREHWRIAARLLKAGEPRKALATAATLLRAF